MKNILVLSSNDDRGDGIAAYDVAKCLVDAGYNAVLLVLRKTRSDAFVIEIAGPEQKRGGLFYRACRKIYNRFFKKRQTAIKIDTRYDFFVDQEVQNQLSEDLILQRVPFIPDLILTGSIQNVANTTTLAALKSKTNAEVYMLPMDMAPFTGGCQHAWDCTGYQSDCRNCPAILEEEHKNIAHKNLMIKIRNVKKSGIKILVGSGRLLEQAKKSTLFRDQKIIYNINSLINTKEYNDRHRKYAKQLFDLPTDSKVIFAGAEYTDNERKGMEYFVEALKSLWKMVDEDLRENVIILIASKTEKSNHIIDQIPFNKVMIKFITDERLLSLAYQAADIFVCSSVEDPGPRMVSQALACGTPVAGFEMGILTNMVVNGFNGYKAKLRDSEDLAAGLFHLLSLDSKTFSDYSKNAVRQVEQYSSKEIVLETIDKILQEKQEKNKLNSTSPYT